MNALEYLKEAKLDAEYLFEHAPRRFKNDFIGDWNSLLVNIDGAFREMKK